ncbi:MBL fold metallo-hydrolase [Candidatus Saccharibacteria bacterium]|jgi:L-ascorbate metabolism protein UlaG (beta-lactamase superfamily)|nr:MBL fold metallo-hydrolase [Candidatus Saccharibacteria bacterium]MCA9350836.1 MBL fold metallo-hydrolase [Candidatus Saccharibacteria bacterium]
MIEIEFYGANCVKIKDKKATIIVDDNLTELGLKSRTNDDDISLVTSKDIKLSKEGRFLVNCPGEYEISEISVKGVAARAHIDEAGARATMYVVRTSGFSIAVIGHIYPELTDEQLEELGLVDVVIIPVGGSGYTLDPIAAVKITNKLDPKIVIPTHYADTAIKYEVPQVELGEFIKLAGTPEPETVKQLKLKESELGEKLKVIVVERT